MTPTNAFFVGAPTNPHERRPAKPPPSKTACTRHNHGCSSTVRLPVSASVGASRSVAVCRFRGWSRRNYPTKKAFVGVGTNQSMTEHSNDGPTCPACGAVSEKTYRCTNCGKDLAEEGTGGDWR